ncbi:MAG: tyrosine-type recombinase/integrase [Bacilli bacterium]|nr:tyrosine-type recombinase/integrase [Bacilli bacterium]
MRYIEDFINYLKVVKKDSNYTLTNYKDDLLELYDFCSDLLNIDEIIAREYLEYLYSRGLSRNTISRKLSSIRSFYNYLLKNNKINKNYFKDIRNPKKSRSLPKYVKNNDLEKMFNSFDKKKAVDQRNLLIFELLYATGMRIGELVNVKVADIDRNNNTIKILGKGSKERYVFYGGYASDALDLYLMDGRYKLLKGKVSDYLLINKNGGVLSDRYIRIMINNVVRKCEVDYHISPHTLRHTFATDMLNAGADLMSVKELLGHSTIDTTSIYTHVSNEQIKNIYNLAHPRAKK